MSPADYDRVPLELYGIQKRFAGRMLVNAKCAPHYVRTLFEREPASGFLKAYAGGAGGCPAGTHYMGIRPNGDVTPCPYLPVFGGNLTSRGLREIWERSEPFVKIRERGGLGGRCGACELRGACGGCRARAYGMTGDFLAEDPLCTHVPGTFPDAGEILRPAVATASASFRISTGSPRPGERVGQVPAFVRGMVVRSVEAYCRERGIGRVTVDVLEEVRSRMPTPKMFRPRPPSSQPA